MCSDKLTVEDVEVLRGDNITSDHDAPEVRSIEAFYKQLFDDYPVLSPDEVTRLAKKIERAPEGCPDFQESEESKQAREKLVLHNMRLVKSVAKHYLTLNCGLESYDLIQEGVCGLMTAVERYEWEKGFRFSTYATWWIKQAIVRSIADKSRTVRIPVHMCERVSKIHKNISAFVQKYGREPEDQELAETMGKSLEWIKETRRASRLEPISYNIRVGEDEDAELKDFIPDSVSVEEIVSQIELTDDLDALINEILTEREADCIRLKYGKYDGTEWTLEAIGERYNVSRERIRQIIKKALEKLRNNRKVKSYRNYS